MKKLLPVLVLLATLVVGVVYVFNTRGTNSNTQLQASADFEEETFPLICNQTERAVLKLEDEGFSYGVILDGVRRMGIENNFILDPEFNQDCNLLAFSIRTESSSSKVVVFSMSNYKQTVIDLWSEYQVEKKGNGLTYSNIYTVFERFSGTNKVVVKVIGKADEKDTEELPIYFTYDLDNNKVSRN